jgi:aryl-alcohol dehydrogenase-like predicted oxidoreductase
MQTRKLGFTDLHLTAVGLGTWAMGGSRWDFAWGAQDDADSEATLHRALDLGINWIDTAPVYGLGHSEEIVGRTLAGRRQEVTVATKCGRRWPEGGRTPYGWIKADSIRREAEDSLRRLRTDVIDLYQIHWPDPQEDIEEAWSTVSDLIREGKVRYGGVCNFSVDQLRRIQPIHPVASLQPPYSMLRREVEGELLAYCAEHEIGVVAYSPMQAGLLTGTFSRERAAALPEDDWRRRAPWFQEPQLELTLQLVEKLRPLAARNGLTVAQLALAWVLRRPEVTAAIVGARRPAQIEQTAPAGDRVLPEDDVAEIDALLAWRESALS